MKFIFVIQGEGRGHFTQAMALWQQLQQQGHTLEKVLIGISPFRCVPDYVRQAFPCELITYAGPNFLPSPTRTRVWKSVAYNMAVCGRYFKAIHNISRLLQQSQADKVINFYEPLIGLVYRYHRIPIPLVCIAHQYMFLHPSYTFPRHFAIRGQLLKMLTRISCHGADMKIGLSLSMLPDCPQKNIYTAPPFMNTAISHTPAPATEDHILCYMLNAGYLRQMEKQHLTMPLHVFTDHAVPNTSPLIQVHKLDKDRFALYLSTARGIMCTAGFETVAEALYLHKPVWMVAANFEQKCNAHEASACGAGIEGHHFNVAAFMQYLPEYKPSSLFNTWVDENQLKIARLVCR